MAPQLSGNSLDYIDSYVDNPYMRGLLGMIRSGEGTADPDGYRRMFGGKQFEDLSRHPAQVQRGGQYASDASGAYQFLSSTWGPLAAKYGLQDFSPRNQDRGAVALIREKIPDLEALTKQLEQNGLTPDIVDKLAPVWASLPTKAGKSFYGQPVKSLQELQGAFSRSVSGRAQATGGAPATPGGDDSWMDAFTSSMFKPSSTQGMDAGAGMAMPTSSVIDASDPLKTLANATLRMAGAPETQAQLQGLQNSIATLTAATFPGMKPINTADLMLPEVRQAMQGGGQNDSAVKALQAMFGGGGGRQGQVAATSAPMPSGGPLRVGRVAKPEEDVFPTTGPHLDVRIQDAAGEYINPANAKSLLQNLYVGGKPLYQQTGSGAFEPSYPVTSPFGLRDAPTAGASTFHRGKDFGVGANTPLEWRGGGSYSFSGGVGVIELPDGRKVKLLHTRPS